MTMPTQREIREGILEAQQKKAKNLRIEIDSLVNSIEYQFEPRDAALAYVDQIDDEKLAVYLAGVRKKLMVLREITAEIKHLKRELDGGAE